MTIKKNQPFSLRTAFNEAEIEALLTEVEAALAGITDGPWRVRGGDRGFKPFVEAPEPPERRFGYGIEILGDDDNGYPTRTRDAHFIADARRLVPELANALKQLMAEKKTPQP